jgi:class 3 adenylate cyclase
VDPAADGVYSSSSASWGGRGAEGGRSSSSQLDLALPTLGATSLQTSHPGGAELALTPHIAEWHESVTVLFADIRGFTEMAQQVRGKAEGYKN